MQQKEFHVSKGETFYSNLPSDTRLSKQSEHIAKISFDFQQNLPLASLYASVVALHFGVHNCGNNDIRKYCWPKTVSGRGSDEVVSYLLHYFASLPQNVTTLRLYSDGCGGQNN